MTKPGEHEVYAIRYASRMARRSDMFIGGDPHDGPLAMDYFVWLIVADGRPVVVDTGFNAEVAARRQRAHLRCPIEALRLLGVDPASVADVVQTHLHYDHVGNFDKLPNATFHLREAEMHFAVGRHMRHGHLRQSYEVEDVVGMVRANYAGRVRFHDGVVALAPGIELHPAPGHSPGLQFVRVHTARGWVVLASDVTHYYENMESGRPFTVAVDLAQMLDGFDLLRAAAPTPAHIVPGHDPQVMQRYAPPRPELEGIVVRLDVPPRA